MFKWMEHTNAAVIAISESKHDASVLEKEISTDNYKILNCDTNRHDGRVACYVRNDLSYSILLLVSCEIENVSLKFYFLIQNQ